MMSIYDPYLDDLRSEEPKPVFVNFGLYPPDNLLYRDSKLAVLSENT